jgi:hypothetical protein
MLHILIFFCYIVTWNVQEEELERCNEIGDVRAVEEGELYVKVCQREEEFVNLEESLRQDDADASLPSKSNVLIAEVEIDSFTLMQLTEERLKLEEMKTKFKDSVLQCCSVAVLQCCSIAVL